MKSASGTKPINFSILEKYEASINKRKKFSKCMGLDCACRWASTDCSNRTTDYFIPGETEHVDEDTVY